MKELRYLNNLNFHYTTYDIYHLFEKLRKRLRIVFLSQNILRYVHSEYNYVYTVNYIVSDLVIIT